MREGADSFVPAGFESFAHPVFFSFSSPAIEGTVSSSVPSSSSSSATSSSSTKKGLAGCPICLRTYSDPVTLVKCTHTFCSGCIKRWFRIRMDCPLCKSCATDFIRSPAAWDEEEATVSNDQEGQISSRKVRRRPVTWTVYRIEEKGAKYSESESGKMKRKKRRMSARLQRAIASHLANTSSITTTN